jgi:O-antigen ligase
VKSKGNSSGLGVSDVAVWAIVALVVFVFIAGQAMARSRTGIILTVPAVIVTFFVLAPSKHFAFAKGSWPRRVVSVAGILAVVFLFELTAFRVVDRFTADLLEDARLPFARNTVTAAKSFMPFGSGIGTFPIVYPHFPKNSDEAVDVYANRAHSDLIELWLEAGVLYFAIAAAFLIWLGMRVRALWRPEISDTATVDINLARASVLAIGLLFLHSAVDYPLRTGAMGAVFAYACAMAVPAPFPRRLSPRNSGS